MVHEMNMAAHENNLGMMQNEHQAMLDQVQSAQEHSQALEQGDQQAGQQAEQSEQDHGQALEQIKAKPAPVPKKAA